MREWREKAVRVYRGRREVAFCLGMDNFFPTMGKFPFLRQVAVNKLVEKKTKKKT